MTPNNNFNILPFYTSLEEQDHRKDYSFDIKNPAISPGSKLLPFQIVRDHIEGSDELTVATLVSMENGTSTNILAEVLGSGVEIHHFDSEGYDLIINPSKLIFPTLDISVGLYYIELGDGTNTWYSDLFSVVPDDLITSYLKLEYWDSENIYYSGGHIDYSSDYKTFLYLQAAIGKPEYPFDEEIQERDGYTFIEKQVSEKVYKFKFLATEALCDALRIVRMHDYINIYDGNKKYTVENIIFEPKWQKQGNLAVMEVEFQCDTVIKKIGKGFASSPDGGDFNNDFNADYNK